jgi:hypothetical protein
VRDTEFEVAAGKCESGISDGRTTSAEKDWSVFQKKYDYCNSRCRQRRDLPSFVFHFLFSLWVLSDSDSEFFGVYIEVVENFPSHPPLHFEWITNFILVFWFFFSIQMFKVFWYSKKQWKSNYQNYKSEFF